MNYTAGALVIIGGVLLVVGIRGTQAPIWKTLTTQNINPSVHSFEGGASGDFQYTPFPSKNPGTDPVPRNKPIVATNLSGYKQIAYNDALTFGIDPTYFVNQIQQESGFSPIAHSAAGAEGIAQFMPSTAAGMGIDPWNPTQALAGAAKLMGNYIRTYGSEAAALAAYNAGPGTLQDAKSRGGSNWISYLPQETQNYIKTIMGGGSSLGTV